MRAPDYRRAVDPRAAARPGRVAPRIGPLPEEQVALRVLAAGECSAALALVARDSSGPRFEPRSFAAADEVLASLEEQVPDLIFVDADAQRFDALELCRTL